MQVSVRLSHVCFGSQDLAATIAFYSNLLDAEVVHRFVNDSNELYGVFLKVSNGTFLEFFNQQEPVATGGLFRHVCFEVDDIEEMAEKVLKMGYSPEVKRGRLDRILQFFVHDPDGTMIEFQEHDSQSALRDHV